MSLLAIPIERGQAAPIEVLHIGIGTGKGQVDVVEHAGLARPGLAGATRHEPLRESRNCRGIVDVEECAVTGAVRMRLRTRSYCICGDVLPVRLCKRIGQEPGTGSRPRAYGRADQECAARFIVLAHASTSHCVALIIAQSAGLASQKDAPL